MAFISWGQGILEGNLNVTILVVSGYCVYCNLSCLTCENQNVSNNRYRIIFLNLFLLSLKVKFKRYTIIGLWEQSVTYCVGELKNLEKELRFLDLSDSTTWCRTVFQFGLSHYLNPGQYVQSSPI